MQKKGSETGDKAFSDDENELSFNKPTHFIGIGASAGGLEALLDFFSNMPGDTGAAFIVVQHLSPDFKSFMPELLSKNTSMPIYHAADGHKVEKNTIYLIPPRKLLTVLKGVLYLEDMPHDGRLQLPIDVFFNSLAEDQQHKAVGIVLSGTGSDGSRGSRTLKEAGALIMVQNPETSKFDGMPLQRGRTGSRRFCVGCRSTAGSVGSISESPFNRWPGRILKVVN